MSTINEFYKQLNEANNIIQNIKLPTNYTHKTPIVNKPKGIYFPSEIMANIMSYIPTPLDYHKKKWKIVLEDYEIIKNKELANPHTYGWNLNDHQINPRRKGKLGRWTRVYKNKSLNLQREKEMLTIKPKLDTFIRKLKTKKNIIKYLQVDVGFPIDSYTLREKKAEFIESVTKDLIHTFTYPHLCHYWHIKNNVNNFFYSL